MKQGRFANRPSFSKKEKPLFYPANLTFMPGMLIFSLRNHFPKW
jgi:hypothetical protein